MYWEAITVIEANDLLLQMKMQDYPHAKAADRRKLFKEINRLANPKELKSQKVVSMDDFAKLLAGKG